MSNLRDIVRRHIESETMQEWELSGHSNEQKIQMLDYLAKEGLIDKKVDSILDAFRDEIEKDSPRKKRQRRNKAVYAILNLILTTLIAVAASSGNWFFLWGMAVVSAVIHVYFTIYSD
ncbi:hypothetical protein DCC39_18860 [Pueribacillus theae]|uniref:Uncharacterized protein n=1 Tax=Pueribacillus theae TaxID=2171751 RepID=A0A2U1JHK8_9BACI|nr:hypothetical protein [Pueribacillus theae]PWA04494.1 hypothetical protein DCC39_18860 [Pueribacillus theae]